jgi:outer membrane lipoprotein-sorting protein
MKKIISLIFISFPFLVFSQPATLPIGKILQRMYDAEDNLHSAKFTMHTEERLRDGKFVVQEMFIKLREHPKQIYFNAIKPNGGTEIIWKEGWNKDKMMVSPGSFPFITFSMHPESSLARKDTHQPITNMGFTYVTNLVKWYSKKYGNHFFDYITIKDTVSWDNHSCIILQFDFNDYSLVKYTVGKDENITSIAAKLHLNDYSILVVNPAVDDFNDVKEGDIIMIPNSYARKIEFYMDRTSGLPLRQLIYDGKGLYEIYEMKSFFLNPVFTDAEFSPDYPSYGF